MHKITGSHVLVYKEPRLTDHKLGVVSLYNTGRQQSMTDDAGKMAAGVLKQNRSYFAATKTFVHVCRAKVNKASTNT